MNRDVVDTQFIKSLAVLEQSVYIEESKHRAWIGAAANHTRHESMHAVIPAQALSTSCKPGKALSSF